MRNRTSIGETSLCVLTHADLALFTEWICKDYIRKWLGDPEEWIAELANETGEFDYLRHFIAMHNGTPIGYCHYYECDKTPRGYDWDDEPPGTFAIGYFIGEEAYLGKGFGDAIVQLICGQVIAAERPVRLVADPMPENAVSIGLLVKHGFSLDAATGLYKRDVVAEE